MSIKLSHKNVQKAQRMAGGICVFEGFQSKGLTNLDAIAGLKFGILHCP